MPGKFFLFKYEVGDVIVTRKAHPCGSKEWVVERVGSDIRMKCKGCGRQVTLSRPDAEKATMDVKREGN